MPTNTAKLGIPKPLGTENVTRTAFNTIFDTIDANAQKDIKKATAAPSSPVADDLWIDTSVTPHVLKRYSGTAWVNASPTAAADIGAATSGHTHGNAVAGGAAGFLSGTDKTKLDGITAGAQPNQNTFANVKVGATTIAADTATDTLEIAAGSGVTLTPDSGLDKLTIAADTSVVAPLASPALTGTPTAPTASAGTNTTQVATTAFVTAADNLKAPLASPALTGTPTAPTAASGTNTTQIATTAYVQTEQTNGLATATPLMDGVAAVGVSTKKAREDHVHPTDTTRAPLASPALTGTPTAPTAAPGTNTTQLATTAFVTAADNLKANLASPTFTGTPAAPTAAAGTNTTQLATTAYVQNEILSNLGGVDLRVNAGTLEYNDGTGWQAVAPNKIYLPSSTVQNTMLATEFVLPTHGQGTSTSVYQVGYWIPSFNGAVSMSVEAWGSDGNEQAYVNAHSDAAGHQISSGNGLIGSPIASGFNLLTTTPSGTIVTPTATTFTALASAASAGNATYSTIQLDRVQVFAGIPLIFTVQGARGGSTGSGNLKVRNIKIKYDLTNLSNT